MNRAVALVLNKVLGDWLEGLDSDSLNLSIFSGEVRLGPIRVKTDAMDKFGLPFVLKHGFVNQIFVKIPWTSLTSSPMRIELNGIYIHASPRTKTDWNVDTVKANQAQAKVSQLENFELMNKEQLPDDPGFAGRLVAKIVDNLQIDVTGVYFRYEDQESSTVPFALGVVLKKLQCVTCNKNWVPEFREDAKVTYKMVGIEGLALFLDYGVDTPPLLESKPGVTEKQTFELKAAEETSGVLVHKYLLHPAFLELKVALNKDPANKTIPQIEAQVNLGKPQYPIKVGFLAPQATHLIKCGAFFSDFSSFQTGVLKLNEEENKPFNESEGGYYRNTYITWRNLVLANEKKKAAKVLPDVESYERFHTFEEISKQRLAAIRDFELAQKEAELESKAKALSAPVKEGKASRVKNFIGWGPSDAEKQKAEDERLQQYEQAQRELKLAQESRQGFQRDLANFVSTDTPVFDTTDVTYNRIKAKTTIYGFVFDLGGEGQSFMHMEMDKLVLETTLRATSMTVDLDIKQFTITDQLVKSACFPNLVHTNGLKLVYDQPPVGIGNLTVDAQQLVSVLNIDCLLGLAGAMAKATSGLVDVKAISATASNRSEKYISAGKNYMAKIGQGKFERHPLKVALTLVAPCIVIPLNLHETKNMLVIDLGTLSAVSYLADPNSKLSDEQLYDRYQFQLKDMEICTVWECASLTTWKTGSRSPLFKPAAMTLDVSININPIDTVLPAFLIDVNIAEVPITLSDLQLCTLLQIKDHFLETLAANMPKPVSAPQSSQAQTSTESAVVSAVREEVQAPASAQKMTAVHVHFFTKQFTIDLYSKDTHIFNFSIEKTLSVISMTREGNIILDYKIENIYAKDMRPEVYWRLMLGDPKTNKVRVVDEEEDAFLKHITQEQLLNRHKAASDVLPTIECDVSVRLAVLPSAEIQGLVRLGSMCVIANPDSLKALMDIPGEAFKELEARKAQKSLALKSALGLKLMSKALPKKIISEDSKVVKTVVSSSKLHFKIVIDCIELRLPLDSKSPNTKVFCLYVETSLLYHAEQTYDYSQNAKGAVVKSDPRKIDMEARVDIYKVGMVVGQERDAVIVQTDSNKGDLIEPCRLSVSYAQQLQGTVLKNYIELMLETFDVEVGFRDIQFFKDLGSHWSSLSSPAPVEKPPSPSPDFRPVPEVKSTVVKPVSAISTVFFVDVKSECLQLELCDDTHDFAVPLTRSQVGNVSAEVAYSDKEFTLSLAGSIEAAYYNPFVASWEPLLEFWAFEICAFPSVPKAPKQKPKSEEENKGKRLHFEDVKPLKIEVKSITPVKVNVTYSMARTLSVLQKTLAQDKAAWQAEGLATSSDGTKSVSSQINYKVKNRSGAVISVKIDGPSVAETDPIFQFQLQNGTSKTVSQSLFEKAAGRILGVKKYASLLQIPQTPSTLTLDLGEIGKVSNVTIENLGLYAYETASNVRIIVEISAKTNCVNVVIESALRILNNSPLDVQLETAFPLPITEAKTVQIPKGQSLALPITWMKGENEIRIKTQKDGLVPLGPEVSFRLDEDVFIVLDSVELKTLNHKPAVGDADPEILTQRLVLLNPPLTVTNSLPCFLDLKINQEDSLPIHIEPGQESTIFRFDPKAENRLKWVLDFGAEKGKLQTEFSGLEKEEGHYRLQGDFPSDKLSVKYTQQARFNKCEDCDTFFRPSLDPPGYHGQALIVYNQYWLVNHTAYPLKFTGKKGLLSVPAHSVGMVKCNKSSLSVCLASAQDDPEPKLSKKFNITTPGVAGLVLVEPKEKQADFPSEIALGVLISAGTWPIVKSTVIHLYPRYIITNNLPYPIYLRQHKVDFLEELKENDVLEYQFHDGKQQKNLQISADKEHWSSPFSLEEIDDFQVRYKFPDPPQVADTAWWQPSSFNQFQTYTRVVVGTETEATIFISLLPPVRAEIYLKNESSETVYVSQVGSTEETIVEPGSVLIPFAYDNRLEPKRKVKLRTSTAEGVYVFDKMKEFKKPVGGVEVVSEPFMSSRHVIMRKHQENRSEEAGPNVQGANDLWSNLDLQLIVPGFEFSLHDEVPAERFLFSVGKMRLKVKQRKAVTPEESGSEMRTFVQQSVNLRIQHVQLDNMNASPSEFPIIFGGTDIFAASLNPVNPQTVTPFIQVAVVKDHVDSYRQTEAAPELVSSFDCFTYIAVMIQEMQVQVHQDTVTGLLEVVSKLQSEFSKGSVVSSGSFGQYTLDNVCPMLATSRPGLTYNPATLASKVYVQLLNMNSLKIVLSFKSGRKHELVLDPKQAFGLFGLLGRVGGAFINISDSTLHFSSVLVCDSFQTMSSVIGQVVKNYVKQGILQFYKIIGSSDLIGNPIGLIDKLGTGVFEFFSEPVKGLMKASPTEFTKGVGKGVKSLVSGVVSGSFGSVSKITGSLYTVVREVGGDEESANRINATDNVAEGLFHGVKGGIVDLTEGVTGILTKPWRGAKRGGVSGFFKGVSSGLVGAVTAPLSAVLRVSTSVSSSVVAQAQALDDKVKQAGRMRFPRQFGARKVLESYNHELAQAQHILTTKEEFKEEALVFYMRTGPRERVLVTQKNLFYVKKYDIEAIIPLRTIARLSVKKVKNGFALVILASTEITIIPCQLFQCLAKLYHALHGIGKVLSFKIQI